MDAKPHNINFEVIVYTLPLADNGELMIRAFDPNGGIELIEQSRSESCNERDDRIEPLLQMLFGKDESAHFRRIAAGAFIPFQHPGRRLARYLACLIFDLSPAGLERCRERNVEAGEFGAQGIERLG